MTPAIRVMVADDHSQIHLGLNVLQDTYADLSLVSHASNGQEAIDLCEETRPDVIIMDVVMPVMDGIAATRIIHERYPDIKILALSSFQDDESIHEMMSAGAVGYVLKNASLDELANSIRAVHSGANVFRRSCTNIAASLSASWSNERLWFERPRTWSIDTYG